MNFFFKPQAIISLIENNFKYLGEYLISRLIKLSEKISEKKFATIFFYLKKTRKRLNDFINAFFVIANAEGNLSEEIIQDRSGADIAHVRRAKKLFIEIGGSYHLDYFVRGQDNVRRLGRFSNPLKKIHDSKSLSSTTINKNIYKTIKRSLSDKDREINLIYRLPPKEKVAFRRLKKLFGKNIALNALYDFYNNKIKSLFQRFSLLKKIKTPTLEEIKITEETYQRRYEESDRLKTQHEMAINELRANHNLNLERSEKINNMLKELLSIL